MRRSTPWLPSLPGLVLSLQVCFRSVELAPAAPCAPDAGSVRPRLDLGLVALVQVSALQTPGVAGASIRAMRMSQVSAGSANSVTLRMTNSREPDHPGVRDQELSPGEDCRGQPATEGRPRAGVAESCSRPLSSASLFGQPRALTRFLEFGGDFATDFVARVMDVVGGGDARLAVDREAVQALLAAV